MRAGISLYSKLSYYCNKSCCIFAEAVENKALPYYYVRLESESSLASEGTESVDSIQDRETGRLQEATRHQFDNFVTNLFQTMYRIQKIVILMTTWNMR